MPPFEAVAAGAAEEMIVAGTAEQQIVAGAAEDQVLAGTAEKIVVAGAAEDLIAAAAAEDPVVAAEAVDRVGAAAAEDRVAGIRRKRLSRSRMMRVDEVFAVRADDRDAGEDLPGPEAAVGEDELLDPDELVGAVRRPGAQVGDLDEAIAEQPGMVVAAPAREDRGVDAGAAVEHVVAAAAFEHGRPWGPRRASRRERRRRRCPCPHRR